VPATGRRCLRRRAAAASRCSTPSRRSRRRAPGADAHPLPAEALQLTARGPSTGRTDAPRHARHGAAAAALSVRTLCERGGSFVRRDVAGAEALYQQVLDAQPRSTTALSGYGLLLQVHLSLVPSLWSC
jgi:hypothetical protein